MPLLLIRFMLWTVLTVLPFMWYEIVEMPYPQPVLSLAYAVAVVGVVAGTFARVPLRPGKDPTLFPVRAAAGVASIATPAFAVGALWIMPHLEPRTSKLLLLAGCSLVVISLLAFKTAHGLLRETPTP